MNKKYLAVGLVSLAIGFAVSSFAVSNPVATYKVAVVDVQKVVSSSKQVNTLKDEQRAKLEDLTKFVNNARGEVAKETDPAKKKALEEKYNKELQSKKEAIDKDYTNKLTNIDKAISAQIATKAKADGYDLVLAKSVILYGGKDITSEITKIVK